MTAGVRGAPPAVRETAAGDRIEYSRAEKLFVVLLSIYLIAAFIFGLWFTGMCSWGGSALCGGSGTPMCLIRRRPPFQG